MRQVWRERRRRGEANARSGPVGRVGGLGSSSGWGTTGNRSCPGYLQRSTAASRAPFSAGEIDSLMDQISGGGAGVQQQDAGGQPQQFAPSAPVTSAPPPGPQPQQPPPRPPPGPHVPAQLRPLGTRPIIRAAAAAAAMS